MRWRYSILCLLGLLLVGVAFWPRAHPPRNASPAVLVQAPARPAATSLPPPVATPKPPGSYRLANTTKGITELLHSDRAILLENAWVDTAAPLTLDIPPALRAQGDPGTYLVQARGPLTAAFRARLAQAGATFIAYVPINACLVRATAQAAQQLAAAPGTQAVLPYEPYYKLNPDLLPLALPDASPPAPQSQTLTLSLLLFADALTETRQALARLGIDILAPAERSPFGPVLKVRAAAASLAPIASLTGVQEIEPARTRLSACDLSRATLAVASDPIVATNYLGLSGSNVLVNINDTGVDTNQPDLFGRVLYDAPIAGVDTNGHGTHVAGIIAGSGFSSTTVSNAPGSPLPPVDGQFRGIAPGATLFSMVSAQPDAYLQETAALTNAVISANGWTYGNTDYDLAAASYDAAVRDALPGVPGSQPMVYVFAAGNGGAGSDSGGGGIPGSIQSPATAKNVLTVGALEQLRGVSNRVWQCTTPDTNNPPVCQTNQPWLGQTDSTNQVAAFSSRGNVGIGLEGAYGRFKPDVVAPGVWVLSTRSTEWDQAAYYHATNDLGSFFEVLSNLNQGVGPNYRFESGTSMSAAEVAGTLALMEEFFEQRLNQTNSPALMKALLINGARPLTNAYDLHVSTTTNFQGWGLVNLPNSLPAALMNMIFSTSPMLLYDQSPPEALATGQGRTRRVTVADDAHNQPLRFTLVWTDPPGNPVCALKLVNDLDLVVTNLDTGEVYFGNDIAAGNQFNLPWDTNTVPNIDVVNNVENIYLPAATGTNYTVTVFARRVNVNAVTAQANDVVQDYALVISSGDGQVTDALAATELSPPAPVLPEVTFVTNSLTSGTNDAGALLLGERIGANGPFLTNGAAFVSGSTNAVLNLGASDQWRFYAFTNPAAFTNAAFLTFQPSTLSLAPLELRAAEGSNGAPAPPQLDLFVSTDSGLTNLDPTVLSNAWQSFGHSGTETLVLSNAAPATYYLAVKAESQAAAQFNLLGVFSALPFAQADAQGNRLLRGFPVPAPVPAGTSAQPGVAYVLGLEPQPLLIHRVVVTNILTHPLMSELTGTLSHDRHVVVLNHNSNPSAVNNQAFVYDDSSQGDIPGAQPTDGPGSLHDFAGTQGSGQWLLTLASTNQPGTDNGLWLVLEPEPDLTIGATASLLPGACREDYLRVPPVATNLTLGITLLSGDGPVSVQLCPPGASGGDCQTASLETGLTNVSLTLDKTRNPPLMAGVHLVRLCNLGTNAVTVTMSATLINQPTPPAPVQVATSVPVPLLDDAYTYSSLTVTNPNPIISLEVGVRLAHPRVGDLALTLISPNGTRVPLDENRGGANVDMGLDLMPTNTVPVGFAGGPESVTNVFDTGATEGTLSISYSFYDLPDDMRVYYDGQLIYDSGEVSFNGAASIPYGPGSSTEVTIIMNEGGNTNSSTAWNYSLTWTRPSHIYLTFTENPALTRIPIKFASTSFTNLTLSPVAFPPVGGIFYRPEGSLGDLAGQSAAGQWRLEVWDNAAGAIEPQPALLSWQLSFLLQDILPQPVPVPLGTVRTDHVNPGRTQYYAIDVPSWATFATNQILSASAPVNLLFNQSLLPTGTNTAPPDFTLLTGVINGSRTLDLSNSVPPLVPATRYYLGVQNTNATSVSFALQVDFDITPLTAGVPAPTALAAGGGPQYFSFDVPTNAGALSFQLQNLTGNLDLVARRGLPLPTLSSYDYASLLPGTNGQQLFLFTNSAPVPLAPGRWYLGVFNNDVTNVSGNILATVYTNPFPAVTTLVSGVPCAFTNAGPANAADYFRFVVSTNAIRAQFEINQPGANFTLVARRGLPLPGLSSFDVSSANPGTNDQLIVLYDYSSPVQLTPGEWFLGAINLSGPPATYSIKATEFPVYGTNIVITESQAASNSFCLTWTSVPGIHYGVQGRTNITDTTWDFVSPTVTATNTSTTWCLPLPSPYHFFRISEGLVLVTNLPPPPPPTPVAITNVCLSTNGVRLQWTAPTNCQFSVQWTPSLPPTWASFTNAVVSTNGAFTFLDDGTQSAGLGPARFYRLRQLP